MQLPWWGWAAVSAAGFAGTALICTRLTAARLTPVTINVYLFGVGFVVFLLFAVCTSSELTFPARHLGWLAALAVTLFVSNLAVVTAYGLAPNAGLVKAIGTLDLVLVAVVAAVVTSSQGGSIVLPWWKVAGIALCVAGAVLVGWERKS